MEQNMILNLHLCTFKYKGFKRSFKGTILRSQSPVLKITFFFVVWRILRIIHYKEPFVQWVISRDFKGSSWNMLFLFYSNHIYLSEYKWQPLFIFSSGSQRRRSLSLPVLTLIFPALLPCLVRDSLCTALQTWNKPRECNAVRRYCVPPPPYRHCPPPPDHSPLFASIRWPGQAGLTSAGSILLAFHYWLYLYDCVCDK